MMLGQTRLGTTLRVWRDRLPPAQVGLPAGRSRRTVGLRREELAELAGVSVDYIVRLEQGRATTPSVEVVAALARVLQLTRAERDHLYSLAGLQPPGDRIISDELTPGVQRLLSRLGEIAVGVFAADWRLLWWSRTWAALLGDPSRVAPEDRNFVRARFPVAGSSACVSQWPVRVTFQDASDRAIVADVRRASARYPEDRRLTELLQRTLDGNAHFAQLWGDGAVGEHAEDRKTVEHPLVGEIRVDCDVLHASDADLRLVVMTAAPGSEDARRIARAVAHAR
ncbi:XRE family transcriptional regulator [Corallococcus sp. CA053C]|uniref:helix-turn-helix transcriptional regulator n=1 Tax=Corallococcus sp. CA053C TaxID=2316732 RepID=UPI000EA38ECF|nr:helix-turn-helix transcriptional regulator [Corallococcus sp. CA053C]RKH11600.1 XRE family transcriptional regulator [Corallococcus sp. CA053C]